MVNGEEEIDNLMRALQTPYIAVLNFFYRIIQHTGARCRNIIIGICCFGLVVYPALNYSELIRDIIDDYNYKMLLICVLVILLALFGMKEKVKPVPWRWPFVIVYYLFAVSILVARFHHSLANGYTMFALFLIIVLPAYGLVWNNRGDYRQLFDWLAFAIVVVGLFFYVGSLIVWPYAPYLFHEGRYTGLTTNPNLLGMLYVCVVAAACYLIYKAKHLVIAEISLGCAIAMLFLSESRTAILVGVLSVVAAVICFLRKREVNPIQGKKLVASALLALIIAIGATFALSAPIKFFSYFGVEKVKEHFDSDKKFSLKECEEMGISVGSSSRIFQNDYYEMVLDNNDIVEVERVASAEDTSMFARWQKQTDMNAYGSGRVGIYKWVLEHSTFWGVDREKNPVNVDGLQYNGTHNTVLDYTYQCGWISGIVCFLLKLFAIIYVIRFLFGKRKPAPGALFAVLFIIVYAVESSLEIQTIPSTRDITCYFYLMLPVVFAGLKKKQSQSVEEEA